MTAILRVGSFLSLLASWRLGASRDFPIELGATSARPRCHALASLAVALLLCCAAAPVSAADRCAGGGKPWPDEGGIGGTGARPPGPEEDDSGVGGTGISADGDTTGIIGTITGFGSICVGGVEIHYGEDSTVELDGEPARPDQLAVGQVVEVVAAGTGAEVRARHIAVRHVVAGPVTRSDPDRNQLDVMGETVQLLAATRSGEPDREPLARAADYPTGAFVRVSGFRRADGVVVASLLTRGEGGASLLEGPVVRVAPGLLGVAGTEVSLEREPRVSVGDVVRVAGRWEEGKLRADSVESVPRIPFAGRVTRLDIEGYPRAPAAGGLEIGPFVLDLPASVSTQALAPDRPARVRAVVRNRRAIVERIETPPPLPSLPAGREGAARGAPGETGRRPPADGGMEKGAQPPPHDRPGAMPPKPHEAANVDLPPRPDRPERPDRPKRPDRPPRVDRPALPDRPPLVERPPRPERPEVYRRP